MKDELKKQLKKIAMVELPTERYEFLGVREIEGKDGNFELYVFHDKQDDFDLELYEREVEGEINDAVAKFWGTKAGIARATRRYEDRRAGSTTIPRK